MLGPNITGQFENNGYAIADNANVTGAFQISNIGTIDSNNNWAKSGGIVSFRANRSSSTYGGSSTVQPPSILEAFIMKCA